MVSPTPRSESVEARTKAATELVASLSGQGSETLLALVQGIVRQFTGSKAENGTIEWLLRTLKQHDPAVSENLSENKLELRCIAAIVLGELLFQSKEKPEKRAVGAAAGLVSAMNMRALPRERHLRTVLEELSGLALGVLEMAADARRTRIFRKLKDEDLTPPDIPNVQKVIIKLHNQIADLNRNAIIDREEISLFWFIVTGFSRTKRKPFSDLPVSVAAVHAALDLYRSVLIPAPLNCFEILGAVVGKKREGESLKPIPLKDHIVNWSAEEWDAVAAIDSPEADFGSKFPAVFPLIWIANRMREGQCLPNWTEFYNNTRLRESVNLNATTLAHQLLREKTTVSLMGGLLE
jgi:hypothetical protein